MSLVLTFILHYSILQVDNVKAQCNENLARLMEEIHHLEMVRSILWVLTHLPLDKMAAI